MRQRGRPKNTYEVRYSEYTDLPPADYCPVSWSAEFALSAIGDLEWAAKAMALSKSYLRTLIYASKGRPVESVVIFRGCRLRATLTRI